MKELKNNQAITLIALVITIVVLLILAGVTISVLTGDNGLITKTTEAKEKNEEAEGLEKIQLAVMASRDENGINTTALAKNLSEISGLTDTNNQEITEINLPQKIKLNNIKYIIKENGQVERFLPKEYQEIEYIESTGTQYIDTEIFPNNNMIIDIKWLITAKTDWDTLFRVSGNFHKSNELIKTYIQLHNNNYYTNIGVGNEVGWQR